MAMSMKKDVRLLRRELRNARLSNDELIAGLETLPSLEGNARWMHQDGTACDEEETSELLASHEVGKDKLMYAKED